MINIDELDREILALEQRDTTHVNCERLAPLYIVREYFSRHSDNGPEMSSLGGDNELIQLLVSKNNNAAWAVFNELMDSIQVLFPNLYENAISEIKKA